MLEKLSAYFYPENFEIEDRLYLRIKSNEIDREAVLNYSEKLKNSYEQIPGILNAAQAIDGPFSMSYQSNNLNLDGKRVQPQFRGADESLHKVLGLQILEGSWFTREEVEYYAAVYPFDMKMEPDSMFDAHIPIVIDDLLAKVIRSKGPVLGREIKIGKRSGKVMGVVKPVKTHSFNKIEPCIFFPYQAPFLNHWRMEFFFTTEKNADFSRIFSQIETVTHTFLDSESWSIDRLAPMGVLREELMSADRDILILLAFLSAFLLFSSLLGMVGIFTYNINKRKPEIGVLRAIGSSKVRLQQRLIAEMVLVSLLGIVPALFLLIQLPLLNLYPFLDTAIYYQTLVPVFVFMMLMVVLFTWYPAMKASQIEPAQALKEE